MSSIAGVSQNGVSVTVYENGFGVHVSGVRQQLYTVSYAQGRSVSVTGEDGFSPQSWFQQGAPQAALADGEGAQVLEAGEPEGRTGIGVIDGNRSSEKVRRLQRLAHGCVDSMDVPRGFQFANDARTKMEVTRFSLLGDERTIFMSSRAPLPDREFRKLTELLKRQCGPLSRVELKRVGELVEALGSTRVGDNQFAPEAGEFGTPEAPRFFLIKADIVNLSGCHALFIEGCFVCASWTPGAQTPKANYAGAFFTTPDGGVQSISMRGSADQEGRPDSSAFQNHYYKFLRTLKTLQWRGVKTEEESVETNQPCLILRIGEPMPDGPHEIRWVS